MATLHISRREPTQHTICKYTKTFTTKEIFQLLFFVQFIFLTIKKILLPNIPTSLGRLSAYNL